MNTTSRQTVGNGSQPEASVVSAGGYPFHVERTGAGPLCLLLHGTGASTHSWNKLTPLLAAQHTVLSVDLPGHARTVSSTKADLSLPSMASALLALLDKIELPAGPVTGVGHSAGAAILAQMSLQQPNSLARLISLNGALMPLNGLARLTFSPLARASARTPFLGSLFARRVRDPAVLKRLLSQTGSTLDAEGIRAYQELGTDANHVSGALKMMAAWRLERLYPKLPQLNIPVHLVTGARDRMIPPRDAYRLQEHIPGSTLDVVDKAGHLAHEEVPEDIARLILSYSACEQDAHLAYPNTGDVHVTAARA